MADMNEVWHIVCDSGYFRKLRTAATRVKKERMSSIKIYGMAAISKLLKNMGLFCRKSTLL